MTTLAGGLTANGLMNSGTGVWILNGGTSPPQHRRDQHPLQRIGITITTPITGRRQGRLSAAGTLNLGVGGTFSGGLVVNSGTVASGAGSSNGSFGSGTITVMAA